MPLAATSANALSLSIGVDPMAICTVASPGCPAGASVARVSLGAVPAPLPPVWPKIQVVFAIDGTFMNGDFRYTDDDGYNECDRTGDETPCEESNGIPVFTADATAIAQLIQSANPRSAVTYALADFESTECDYGDCDGNVYRVDVGHFVGPADFGTAVRTTFQDQFLDGGYSCYDCDYWDNFLHAPTITALYGILTGAGIAWSADAHHVVVVMGDTAPRDPAYLQNYCVSGWDGGEIGGSCYNQACEPSFPFSTGGRVPECEGWVTSRDGNPGDSIAALAHEAAPCVESLGGSCTIDTIDLWSSNTDPYSMDWPAQFADIGGAPGGAQVDQNVLRVLNAGCDMAAATGGTWDGPAWYTCADGQSGTLQYEPHGPVATPNLNNPTLLAAFESIGVGSSPSAPLLYGGDRPMFEFVPIGAITLAPDLAAAAACSRGGVPLATCQTTPTRLTVDGVAALGWNWSTVAAQNFLMAGDAWTAEFNVVATGPPYARVPVDACTTVACTAAGSHAVGGQWTAANYALLFNGNLSVQSFPLGQITVVPSAATPLPGAPPPPPLPPGAGLPVISPAPLPVAQPVAIPGLSVLSGLSVNATAVGLLTMGFMRVILRNKPTALQMAMLSGVGPARAAPRSPPGPEFGRLE